MHIKAHAGKGLTNADIEEIVTNISPNPQSWRYISFSTAERSPKCNSTQEKSPSEQCVHTGKWKQHQDTLEKKTFFCVHHLESFQLKLEPQSTQVGAKIMVSPHGGDDMLAQVWSWSEYLSTYFTGEIFVVNHLSSMFQYTAKQSYKQGLSSERHPTSLGFCQTPENGTNGAISFLSWHDKESKFRLIPRRPCPRRSCPPCKS